MLVYEYIVCQSAKWCCKIIEGTCSLERILKDCHKPAVYRRLHDIQSAKAYYIFVL